MNLRELFLRILYFLIGKGPAEYVLYGTEGTKVRLTKSGALIFGIRVRPYFKSVAVKISAPGNRMLYVVEGEEQRKADGLVLVEVTGQATIWVSAQEFRGNRVDIELADGWLRKRIMLEVVPDV